MADSVVLSLGSGHSGCGNTKTRCINKSTAEHYDTRKVIGRTLKSISTSTQNKPEILLSLICIQHTKHHNLLTFD